MEVSLEQVVATLGLEMPAAHQRKVLEAKLSPQEFVSRLGGRSNLYTEYLGRSTGTSTTVLLCAFLAGLQGHRVRVLFHTAFFAGCMRSKLDSWRRLLPMQNISVQVMMPSAMALRRSGVDIILADHVIWENWPKMYGSGYDYTELASIVHYTHEVVDSCFLGRPNFAIQREKPSDQAEATPPKEGNAASAGQAQVREIQEHRPGDAQADGQNPALKHPVGG